MQRAATCDQPAGMAFPNLVPTNLSCIEEHLRIAKHTDPFAFFLENAVTAEHRKIVRSITLDPIGVMNHRLVALRTLHEIDTKLTGFKTRWRSALPKGSPAKSINFSLMHFIAINLSYQDEKLTTDLSRGLPVAGYVPHANCLTIRPQPAKTSISDWSDGIEQRNILVYDRLMRSANTDLAAACWDKTAAEVSRGWVSAPQPITPDILRTLPLTPRFCILEDHGSGPKHRLIDDYKMSGINDTLELEDTSVPQSLNTAYAMARTYGLAGCQLQLLVTIVDFAHAYKHVGIDTAQDFFSYIALVDKTGSPFYAKLNTQPFGSRRAPSNWARVTNFFEFALRRLFKIWLGVYVDDCFTIETERTAANALRVIKDFASILGLELAPNKQVGPIVSAQLLGARISLLPDRMKAEISDSRAAELVLSLREVLLSNKLSPASAAKLRGRLGFAQSLVFARHGRAMLQPFTRRQYSHFKRRPLLSAELRFAILWWIQTINENIPRTIPFVLPKPTIAYSDACGAAHIGVFIERDNKRFVCDTHAPNWFTDHLECHITELEMLAALLALCCAILLLPGLPLLLFVDNSAVVSCLINGTGQSALARKLMTVFWRIAAANSIFVWVEWVPTHLQVADPPSRCCSGAVVSNTLTANAFATSLPTTFVAALQSECSLSSAQTKQPKLVPSPIERFPCVSNSAPTI